MQIKKKIHTNLGIRARLLPILVGCASLVHPTIRLLLFSNVVLATAGKLDNQIVIQTSNLSQKVETMQTSILPPSASLHHRFDFNVIHLKKILDKPNLSYHVNFLYQINNDTIQVVS